MFYLFFFLPDVGHVSKDCPKPDYGKLCYKCGDSDHLLRSCSNYSTSSDSARSSVSSLSSTCSSSSNSSTENLAAVARRRSSLTALEESTKNTNIIDSLPPHPLLMPAVFYPPPPVPHLYSYCVYPDPTFYYPYPPAAPISGSTHPSPTTQTCFSCGMFGHTSRDCMNNGQICYHCGDIGHVSKECAVSQDEKVCYRCKSPGHKAVKCAKPSVPKQATASVKNKGDEQL